MFRARHLQNNLRFCLGTLALVIPAVTSLSQDFDHLVKDPAAYKGRRVSVIGVAEVNGTSFTLFEPPNRDLSRTIFVVQKLGKPRYNSLDNHWVRIEGMVEPDEQGNFACKIFLEKVEALPRSPVPSINVFGIFLNDGSNPVEVYVVNKAGNETAEIALAPGQVEKTAISDGVAKVYTPSDSFLGGKLLSSLAIPSEKSAAAFFESSTRTFYFKITNGKIALLQPGDATELKK